MDKFQNKYRIGSARLKNWDYGNNAPYFVTICIRNHEKLFGEISDGEMILNENGEIAEKIWMEIPEHFNYAELGCFVVMPNHFHGIICIKKLKKEITVEKQSVSIVNGGFAGIKNPMLNENISRIVRWYKGRVTFEIRKNYPNFEWQSRFWDHVIRNEESFNRIENYIQNNPKNWVEDKFHF